LPTVDCLPDQIEKAKVEAAQVMETTLGRLDDAFITPLDREDIMQLITDLYDVIEGVADVGRRFSLYKITEKPWDRVSRPTCAPSAASPQSWPLQPPSGWLPWPRFRSQPLTPLAVPFPEWER
jgi:hypothetical protein